MLGLYYVMTSLKTNELGIVLNEIRHLQPEKLLHESISVQTPPGSQIA